MTLNTQPNQFSNEDLDEFVIATFPSPIAINYERMLKAPNSKSRVNQAIAVFEISQRLLTFIALSQYLIYDIYEMSDPEINDLLRHKLPQQSFGGWTNTLFTILKAYQDKQHLFVVPELYDFYEERSDFDQVVMIRNDLAHEREPKNENEWEELELNLLSTLRAILARCSFLANYWLIQITEIHPNGESEYRLHRGPDLLIRRETLLHDNWHSLRLGEYYLLREDKFALQLHPFVLHWAGKLEHDSKTQEDIAFFARLTTNTAEYSTTSSRGFLEIRDQNFVAQLWGLILRERQPSVTITLAPDGQPSRRLVLDTTYLEVVLSPYIRAITQFQHLVDEIQGNMPHLVRISSITQNSPISVSLQGAKEASDAIRDVVVPWRREHSKIIAKLDEQARISQIEALKAENLEKRSSAQKNRAEAIKLQAEAAKARAEADKLSLENEKLRIELHESRINLAIKILSKLSSDLSETQRIIYIMKLLEPLGVLTDTNSPLPITDPVKQ